MAQIVVGILLILAWLGVEAWLIVVGAAIFFTDPGEGTSGRLLPLMILLIPGVVLGLLGGLGGWALRLATVYGVLLLAYGVWLVVEYGSAYRNDVNSGTFSLGMLLPGVLVLGGAWLMNRAGRSGAAPPTT